MSNDSVSGSHADTRLLTNATRGSSFYANHDLRDNVSPQPDPEIRDQSTVDNAGIGSPPDTAPEQSSDMATAEFTPVAGEADPGKMPETSFLLTQIPNHPHTTPMRESTLTWDVIPPRIMREVN
ncbi:MAG: hypothetical protein GY797_28755 [Deltaproteobacteria bacterium]|nr:hypothetical protein [Deltaproteobacteria bacterium]